MTLRRFDDERAMEHIVNARQLLWASKEALLTAGFSELVLDLEAADRRLTQATRRLSHPRVLTYDEAEEVMAETGEEHLKLHVGLREGRRETLSVPMAEIISRAWQAVAFIEEMRVDLGKQVRQSQTRDLAMGAFETALSHLVMGAQLMLPANLLQLPKLATATQGADQAATSG